ANPRQPVGNAPRYDFVISVRTASPGEIRWLKTRAEEPVSYPQREAVLFALRELTGKDVGATAEAWLAAFPKAEFELEVARLAGKDFGPPPRPSLEQRVVASNAWNDWWVQQRK